MHKLIYELAQPYLYIVSLIKWWPISYFTFHKWLVSVCNIHNDIWMAQTKTSHLGKVSFAIILLGWWYMCCNLAGLVLNREHWLLRYSKKKECISIVFYCSENLSIAITLFGTTGSIQAGFAAKCTSPNEDFNHVENWKCHMFDFRPIPLDRII